MIRPAFKRLKVVFYCIINYYFFYPDKFLTSYIYREKQAFSLNKTMEDKDK